MKEQEKWEIFHSMSDKRLREAIKLDEKVYSKQHIGIYKKCKQWISANKSIYTVLCLNGRLVGYINFMPVTEECYEKFKLGTYDENDIKLEEIREYKEKGEYKGILISISVKQEYRDGSAILKLWSGFEEKLGNLRKKGLYISSILANCVSIDGIKHITNHVNGKFICSSKDGKIYEGNFNLPERTIPKLRYEELNNSNLKILSKMQYEIFKEQKDIGYIDLLNELNAKDINKPTRLPITFLVYNNDIPVGIIGLYQTKSSSDDVWLSWLGVLPEYRHRGIGTQMVFYMLALARQYNKTSLRLFTFTKLSPDAQNIYRKTMQIEESYDNKRDCVDLLKKVECKVFSSSLIDKIVKPWNNKYIGVKEIVETYDENFKKLKEDGII